MTLDLINNPLTVWQRALHALIATAPCGVLDLIATLIAASQQVAQLRLTNQTTQAEASVIDRLLLLSAGALLEQQRDHERPELHQVDPLAIATSHANLHCTLTANAQPASAAEANQRPAHLQLQVPPLNATKPAPLPASELVEVDQP